MTTGCAGRDCRIAWHRIETRAEIHYHHLASGEAEFPCNPERALIMTVKMLRGLPEGEWLWPKVKEFIDAHHRDPMRETDEDDEARERARLVAV